MNEFIASRDVQQMRLAVMITRALDTLRGTVRLRLRSGALVEQEMLDEVVVDFTDESERVIAPFIVKADMLGALQPKHLSALRAILLDYIGKPDYIEEFTRVIQGDTVTIEELLLLVITAAEHAEMVE
jgi:hypothetical protein